MDWVFTKFSGKHTACGRHIQVVGFDWQIPLVSSIHHCWPGMNKPLGCEHLQDDLFFFGQFQMKPPHFNHPWPVTPHQLNVVSLQSDTATYVGSTSGTKVWGVAESPRGCDFGCFCVAKNEISTSQGGGFTNFMTHLANRDVRPRKHRKRGSSPTENDGFWSLISPRTSI